MGTTWLRQSLLGFGIEDLGLESWDLGLRIWDLGCPIPGRVQGQVKQGLQQPGPWEVALRFSKTILIHDLGLISLS